MAKELGYVDVDGMLDSIPHLQLMEWIAFLDLKREEEKEAEKTSESRTTVLG